MIDKIGSKVRVLRRKKNMTLTELSSITELSIGFLSNLERDMSSPTLENIQRICSALDISLVKLLESAPSDNYIIREDERVVVFDRENEIHYESVSFELGLLDGLFIKIEPNCEFTKEWAHAYDEIGLILEGQLIITLDGCKYTLNKGDSFYIKAQTKHSLGNISRETCISYWVKQSTDNHI